MFGNREPLDNASIGNDEDLLRDNGHGFLMLVRKNFAKPADRSS